MINNSPSQALGGLLNTGVGRQVEATANKFKQNPAALAQQAQKSGNLLDAIAAHRALARQQQEKQIAAMQMQQQPGTVVEQEQQALLAGEKELMRPALSGIKSLRAKTKDVGGALAQKQAQQQQNMQRMAQRPQGQPQQPVMARHGGLMTQAAPNLERMYGGGIVAFTNGGRVWERLGISEEEYNRRIDDLVARGLSKEQAIKIQETAAGSYTKEFPRVGGGIGAAYQMKADMLKEPDPVAEEKQKALAEQQDYFDTLGTREGTVELTQKPPVQGGESKTTGTDTETLIAPVEPEVEPEVELVEPVEPMPINLAELDAEIVRVGSGDAAAMAEGFTGAGENMRRSLSEVAAATDKEAEVAPAVTPAGGVDWGQFERDTGGERNVETVEPEETEQTLEELYREMAKEQLLARQEGIKAQQAALEEKRKKGSTWYGRLAEGAKQYARDAGSRDVDTSNRGALASLGSGIATAQANLESDIAKDEAGIASLQAGLGKDAMANLTGLEAITHNKEALALQSLLGEGRLSLDEQIALNNLSNKARELTIKEDQFDRLLVYRQATQQQQKELENKKLALQEARDAVDKAYKEDVNETAKQDLIRKYKEIQGAFVTALMDAEAEAIKGMGVGRDTQAAINILKAQNRNTIDRYEEELEVELTRIQKGDSAADELVEKQGVGAATRRFKEQSAPVIKQIRTLTHPEGKPLPGKLEEVLGLMDEIAAIRKATTGQFSQKDRGDFLAKFYTEGQIDEIIDAFNMAPTGKDAIKKEFQAAMKRKSDVTKEADAVVAGVA